MERLPLKSAQAPTKVTLNVGRAANRLATLEGFINESSREGRRAFSSVSAFSIMSSLRILDTSAFVRLGKGSTTRGRRRRPDLG